MDGQHSAGLVRPLSPIPSEFTRDPGWADLGGPSVPSIPMGSKRCRSSELLDYPRLDMHHTIGNVFRSITKGISKSKKETDFDLYGEEREHWEKSVLQRKLDLTQVQIDPSPFQMVETTSLFKVHSLFSLLGLKRAYITKDGRLVGVVSLMDLRHAIESVQSGVTPSKGEVMLPPEKPDVENDEVDYLHPQLEVLTRPNTCEDLSDLSEESKQTTTPAPDSVPIPSINLTKTKSLPNRMAPSVSDPCMVPVGENDEQKCSDEPAAPPQFSLDDPSIASSNGSENNSNVHSTESDSAVQRYRNPPHVRIVMPDEDRI
ncbi:hypothetical protein ANCCAN_07058 [Ancylostoma caninum]|uniref:CBS domain-containing protein n=1 Tax=Ancylostoma caninum TaxID=29170 RepID=A0A368GUA1_ANCCA|nr:hypothetical protein ANCCAN_07058 [Ancylostoma caninum]